MQTPLGRNRSFAAISKTFFPAILLLILTSCNQSSQSKSGSTPAPQAATSAGSTNASAGTDSGLPDPCKLLSNAEAQGILGEAVRDPEPSNLGGVRICDYKTVAVHGGVTPYWIHIAIVREQREVWDAGKKLHLDSKEARLVMGIGDDAYFLLDDLEVLSKQRSIAIGVMKNVDKPDHAKAVEEAEKAVAEKILPRM